MVRYKARYLLFNILYPTASPSSSSAPGHIDFLAPSDPTTTTPSELAAVVRETLALQFGDWGSGVAGNLSVKYFSPATSTGIVRVGREQYRLVWAALTYIKEIKRRPCVIRVVHVSGTIKKAEIEAVRRAKRDIRLVSKDVVVDIAIDDYDDGGDDGKG